MVCTLLPGIFGALVQGALFLGVCATLLWKKLFDEPPRSWPCFLADGSKQIVGAGWIHALNILSAMKLRSHLEAGDECAWYWINVVVDCTAGVFIEYLSLEVYLSILSACLHQAAAEEFRGGHYHERDVSGDLVFHWKRYFKQLGLWLLVVSQMKLCVVTLTLVFHGRMLEAAEFVLDLFVDERSELLMVTVFTPFFMNALQFWVVDNFLKRNSGEHEALRSWGQELC